MKIRSSFSQALANPFVDALLAAKTFQAVAPMLRGTDDSQQFLDASLASGAPVSQIPRRGLSSLIAKTGLISPMETASPDVMNREKMALNQQSAENLGTAVDLRSKLGPTNYAALSKDPRFASMLKNAPDFAGELPGETKENKVYAYNEKTGDEVALKPGEKPPTGYVTGSFFKKPAGETETQLFERDPKKFSELMRAKHQFDKSGTAAEGTYAALDPANVTVGPDGKTRGVWRINNRTNTTEFTPVAGAPLGSKTEKQMQPLDSANDALAALDDLDNSLDALPPKSGMGSGVIAKMTMESGRHLSSDPAVATFDSAKSRIIEIASALRKQNRLNAVEFRAIYGGLPNDSDSQESARVKINNMRAFLGKIVAREQSRMTPSSDLGATTITGPTADSVLSNHFGE